ncbi:hypothetical protein F5148DRAFT_1368574 [Russula earlei]|uniref:Uncharacterized protein n=1 Tax=Russula earlei TaxID=71964 RepID=A0ACC0U6J7_9AGAM|nr:hypothetical protein F5148DRAFT_1368574 [Russula earlei]
MPVSSMPVKPHDEAATWCYPTHLHLVAVHAHELVYTPHMRELATAVFFIVERRKTGENSKETVARRVASGSLMSSRSLICAVTSILHWALTGGGPTSVRNGDAGESTRVSPVTCGDDFTTHTKWKIGGQTCARGRARRVEASTGGVIRASQNAIGRRLWHYIVNSTTGRPTPNPKYLSASAHFWSWSSQVGAPTIHRERSQKKKLISGIARTGGATSMAIPWYPLSQASGPEWPSFPIPDSAKLFFHLIVSKGSENHWPTVSIMQRSLVPSVRPYSAQPIAPSKPGKGEGEGKAMAAAAPDPPRSAAVRGLDEPLAGLNSSESTQPSHNKSSQKATTSTGTGAQADPREGCFCQARVHALSENTPLCTACGLVLCAFTPATPPLPTLRWAAPHPARACGAHRATLAEEAAAREREAEAVRLAEGVFPILGPSPPPQQQQQQQQQQLARRGTAPAGDGYRVLPVDSRTGRVKVDSYPSFLTSSAMLLLPGHGSESEEEAAAVFYAPSSRVPPPPREVEYVRVRRGPATRWVDLRGGEVRYASAAGRTGIRKGRAEGTDERRLPSPVPRAYA